ncbi:MAG TPA: hypothetical protein GX520_08680 [Syntrophaceticus sp.]|jgi:hypothetical protein|nr:hypothetical protein [Syntrophaceticus sp.]
MRHFIVTASIFVLIAAATAAWQLGIFKEEDPGLNTPLPKQQVKLMPPVGDYIDNAEKTNNKQKERNQAVLQEEIEARYTAHLLSTAQDYEKRLNSLANTAWEEYTEAQQEGKNISKPVAFKYFTEGQKLKTKCDNEIYTILQNFEAELSANSLPLDKANMCRREYERRKSERKQEILEIISRY